MTLSILNSRSGKHSSSNASTHAEDFDHLYNVPEFDQIMKFETDGEKLPKPVVIIICDGGPDENPRYQQVIEMAITHFLKYDLDALFIATNAPHRSAYNRVERRMAPLSHAISGLVLPHDFYGTHLNDKNETVDTELELKNFQKAGETLASIWSETVIDQYPTVARFVSESNQYTPIIKDASWWHKHITFGQYMLQIVKCDDLSCCKKRRSALFNVLKNGFIPPPLPLDNSNGLSIPAMEISVLKIKQFAPLFLNIVINGQIKPTNNAINKLVFDQFCPSVQSKISSRTCDTCGKYFSCLKYLKTHEKLHKKQPTRISVPKESSQEEHSTKTRPKRIAAIRANELLAIISYDLNMEDAEWFEREDLDLSEIELTNSFNVQCEESNPTISIEKTLTSQWVEKEADSDSD